jgi:hypothetical protein
MLLAWILFANLGAFTARYCKTIFQVQGWSALIISHCQILQDHIPGTGLVCPHHLSLPNTARPYSRYRAGLTYHSFPARYCKTIFQVQGWSSLTISHCQILQDYIPGTGLVCPHHLSLPDTARPYSRYKAGLTFPSLTARYCKPYSRYRAGLPSPSLTVRYCKTIFQVEGWSALTISYCQILRDHIPGTGLVCPHHLLLPDTARPYSRYRAGLTSPSLTARYCKTIFLVQRWSALTISHCWGLQDYIPGTGLVCPHHLSPQDTARPYSRYRAGLPSPSLTARYCKTIFQVQGWSALTISHRQILQDKILSTGLAEPPLLTLPGTARLYSR